MPRPRTTITPVESAPALPVTPEGDLNPLGDLTTIADTAHAESEVKRAIRELGDNVTGAKVQIWRIRPGERYPAYVTTYPPDSFSLERVADDCGGGTYDIKVYAPQIDEQGRQKGLLIVARPRVFLDGPPKVIQRPDKEPELKTVAGPATSDIALLAKAMQDGFAQMAATLTRSQERPSMVETLKELVAIKTLFSNDASRGPDPLTMFEKFLDMREKMSSAVDRLPAEASDNQLLLALGRDFLTMFRHAPEAGQQPQLPDPNAAPAPVPEPNPSPPPVIPVAPEPENAMLLIYKGYVTLLLEAARANNDVEPTAQMIYDQAPDELLTKLFNTPEWIEELAKINPQVKLYPQWFERLRARIREIHDADQTGA